MDRRIGALAAGTFFLCATAHSYDYPQRLSHAGPGDYVGTVQGGTVESRSISADGRYVAFIAATNNFLPGTAAANRRNAFVIDRQTRAVENVSIGLGGALADADVTVARISADGRYVAFVSAATNLVAGDTNGYADVFVYDRTTATTELASVGAAGEPSNFISAEAAISADGRYVAFTTSATNIVPGGTQTEHVYRRDMTTGTTERASVDATGSAGNSVSHNVALSPDGRYVAFDSYASNLVAGDDNGVGEVFVRDMLGGTIVRVSRNQDGTPSSEPSRRPTLCSDPRYVVFEADGKLVPSDISRFEDIYVYDIVAATTRVLSAAPGAAAGNGFNQTPALSADCRYAAFASSASNLVAGDTNGRSDVFRVDLATATIERASIATGGAQGAQAAMYAAVSGDGRYVLFNSESIHLDPADGNDFGDAFVRDMTTATTTAAVTFDYGTQAAGDSVQSALALSSTNRHAAFVSRAPNLAPGALFPQYDVYRRNVATGATQRVNVTAAGDQANAAAYWPSISADGRYVAFYSYSTNLVGGIDDDFALDVFVREVDTGTTELVSVRPDGNGGNGHSSAFKMSPDARYVAFQSIAGNLVANDTNGLYDAYLRDRQAGTTWLVSVATNGSAGNAASYLPAVSGDGRYVAFESAASNLVAGDGNAVNDVFLRDMESGTTTLVSRPAVGGANGASDYPNITPDGRYIVFHSSASNLVAGDTNGALDVFVYDRVAQSLQRASVGMNGAPANGSSSGHAVSTDGRYIAFTSDATNLVPNDTNGVADVFVRDLVAQTTARLSVDRNGTQGNAASNEPAIADDGHFVSFTSAADNLVGSDTNGSKDVFLARNPLYMAATTLAIANVVPAVTRYGEPYVVHVVATADHDTPQGSVTIGDGHGATCTAVLIDGAGSCALSSRAVGNLTVTASFVASVAFGASSTTTTHTVQAPVIALSVTIDDATDFVAGGSEVEYTIVVTNDGPDPIDGAQVATTLPANLTSATWTCAAVAPAACDAAGTGAIDADVDLPAQGSVVFTLTGVVAALPELSLVVGVSVAAPEHAIETELGDNFSADADTVGIFRSRFE